MKRIFALNTCYHKCAHGLLVKEWSEREKEKKKKEDKEIRRNNVHLRQM